MKILQHLTFIFFLGSTILHAQPSPSCPCCTEDHRAFDFWVGEWNVYDLSGTTLLGTSNISLKDGDCILQEEWTSAQANYSGRSFNSFDRNSKQWRQYWIDSQGSILQIAGGLAGNSMVMSSTTAAFDTIPETTTQISWTPLEDGRVRQTWRNTSDGGKSWTVLFDGYYAKKED